MQFWQWVLCMGGRHGALLGALGACSPPRYCHAWPRYKILHRAIGQIMAGSLVLWLNYYRQSETLLCAVVQLYSEKLLGLVVVKHVLCSVVQLYHETLRCAVIQ